MRGALALLLTLPLLAGCLGGTETRSNDDETCIQGDCTGSSRSMECVNGDCEVCVDGECASCERDDCRSCVDDGACPMLPQEPAVNETFEDVSIQETYDLTQGLPHMEWNLDSAAGSTGHVRLVLRDIATKENVVSGGACFEYDVRTWDETSWSQSQGSQGDCGNNPAGVSGTTSSSPITLADWTVERRGHYELAVAAGAQPNELVVDIEIDNP